MRDAVDNATARARSRLSALAAAAALAAMLTAATTLTVTGAGAAEPAPAAATQITEAPPLTWGFKTSWRTYVPIPEVAEGAEVVGGTPGQAYDLRWAFASGSYDDETRTTRIDFRGTVHWQKYKASQLGYTPPAGYTGEPDPYILDVTMADPEITISRESAVVSVVLKSRDLDTWEMVDYGRVPLVNLEAVGVTPTVAGGTTTWSEIPAAVSEEGAPAFSGFYRVGAAVDPLSFSYTGPGGAPDFSEHFDEEGAPSLKLARNALFFEGTRPVEYEWFALDREDLLAHSFRNLEIGASGEEELEVETFDLENMSPVGEPLTIPWEEAPYESTVVAYDSNRDRVLYHGWFEEGITRSLEFEPRTDGYVRGTINDPTVSDPGAIGAGTRAYLAWDPTRDQGWRIEGDNKCLRGGPEYEGVECEWHLLTFKEGPDGSWEKKSYAVPGFGPGQFEGGYKVSSTFVQPTYVTASDGSLIVLATARESENPDNPVPARVPVAYRLTLDEADETVRAEPFPLTAPGGTFSSSEYFDTLKTAPGGQIVLVNVLGPTVHCQITAGAVHCDQRVNPNETVETTGSSLERVAVDPEDGTLWYRGTVSQKLAAFREGRLRGAQFFKELYGHEAPIMVGAHHTIYAVTTDGSPTELGGAKTWGWGRFELLGYTPTVTEQPADAAVSLGAGEATKEVTFSAAATGEPAPTVQWQVRTPGASRFTAIAGAVEPTLSVAAEPDLDGAEYRAVYANAAGTVASEAATLGVEYVPAIKLQLKSQTVTEGDDASFSVVADGNPAPTVTWTRRNGEGLWVPIGPGDENFRISQEGDTLTVVEANALESGMRFRAVIANAVGTVRSAVVALTVAPRVEIPAGGIAVTHASLDWLGNGEMQSAPPAGGSNYFSAGISGGNEATYHSVVGNAAVWQVSATGQEALAGWATRAAHVADGGRQVARLYGGEGRVEPDGAADISWNAAFSVNFYGGLVPFTIEDPELKVEPDGTGALTATAVGCSSSQDNPNQCAPLAAATQVVVADFEGVTIEPGRPLTVEPEYLGVTAEVPAGSGAEAQLRSGPDWGSWPQSFVDFQFETGLSSYWYSSGTNDELKPPLPLTVNLEGPAAPAEPHDEGTPSGDDGGGSSSAPAPTSATTVKKAKKVKKVKGAPARVAVAKTVRLGRKGVATIARLACPKGGADCAPIVPARIAVRIGGRRRLIGVAVPRRIKAGGAAAVKVSLSKGARTALGDGKVGLRLRIAVRSGERMTSRIAKVTIVGRG
ncbi:MAG TPA: HtaA domain-containing protein [Solirubrobacterales bacterium]|nr:HtaA domain-containing protein [Solirubrobacterales bacterium]